MAFLSLLGSDGPELWLCLLPALQLGWLPHLVYVFALVQRCDVSEGSFALFPSSTQQFVVQRCPFQLLLTGFQEASGITEDRNPEASRRVRPRCSAGLVQEQKAH